MTAACRTWSRSTAEFISYPISAVGRRRPSEKEVTDDEEEPEEIKPEGEEDEGKIEEVRPWLGCCSMAPAAPGQLLN